MHAFIFFGVGTWSEYGNQSDNEYNYGTQNQSKYGPSYNKKKRQSKALCCDVNLMYYAGNARSLPENGTRKAVADRHIFVRLWFRPSPRLRPICHKKATYSYF